MMRAMDIRKYHRLQFDAEAAGAALHQCADRRRELRAAIRVVEHRQTLLEADQRQLTLADQRRLEADRQALAALDEQHETLQAESRSQRALADACRRYLEQKGVAAHG